ncbi:O-antigen polymerase [Geobacillus vulcani]|uniref:O-antigen polymerase n=1 Tax=Geobacillus vulcani TaxID=135517 RepID=UPI0004DF7D4D
MNSIWWINPSRFVIFILLPLYIIIYVSAGSYIGGVKNYFEPFYFMVGMLLILSIYFSISLALKVKTTINEKCYNFVIKDFFIELLFWLTFIGYFVWFYKLIVNPQMIINYFYKEGYVWVVRNELNTLPGITTLTQCGVVFSIFFVNNVFICTKYHLKIKKRFKVYFVVVFLFTILRSFVWSERLALIELLIPLLLLYFNFHSFNSRISKLFINLFPFYSIVLFVIFFGVTEYFRSWPYYRDRYYSFWNFIIERIMIYYSTAINNGVGILHYYSWPSYSFYFTLNWIYRLPGIGDYLLSWQKNNIPYFVDKYGNPEFTNVAGLFAIVYDLGIIGSFFYCIVLGFFIGIIYNSFKRKHIMGLLLYPIFFISLVEIYRILYLGESRIFYILFFGLLGIIFSRRISMSNFYSLPRNENHSVLP